ncbi:hypothetical protein CIG75_14325 [Tumebacillus algifaecis]|uniref:Uncharacterized protein n=1 Tax=Tumebacillus algifaecis TaxID=1214604 RepID=A0A223D346_9BACL|nr:hypothetical protein [Tumebacillus algifaecis]ASS76022.1 hypothetical protein CIG75_14325 [Tumebacillus algifaecis]
MAISNKWKIVSITAASLLLTGIVISQSTLADQITKKDTKKKLQEDLEVYKGIMHTHTYYKDLVNDPVHGKAYERAYGILMMKFKTIERIERDFNENKKTAEELLNELEELIHIRELVIE